MLHSSSCIIEINDKAAGILLAERNGFIFFAADAAFGRLERRVFRSIGHAEQTARTLLPKEIGRRPR